MSVPAAIDLDGVAVVTGGASGFGLVVAERLVRAGAAVALLDVSEQALEAAAASLRATASSTVAEAPQGSQRGAGRVLTVRCDVARFSDCEAAQQRVAAEFAGLPVTFLFNNAGISGKEGGKILRGPAAGWASVFSVNVFGAVNIIKAFLPSAIKHGPLPSGKKVVVVTTSSVVGLLNHNVGPYSVSKMAVTAMAEQLSLELEDMGEKAVHISPHLLLPTMGGTDFHRARGPDGSCAVDDTFKNAMLKGGMFTAEEIVDAFFTGLDQGRHYIVVDHDLDIPTADQIAARMEDQMQGRRPRKPAQIGMMLAARDQKAFEERKALLQGKHQLQSNL